MNSAVQQILDKIPELITNRDVAELAVLETHSDKQVRKAVRRALHQLKSRGIDVPETQSRNWSAGDSLQQLRGNLQSIGFIDPWSRPGRFQMGWIEPDEVSGGELVIAQLDPYDRIYSFSRYNQTDGQRQRTLRDIQKSHPDRSIPVSWIRQRLLWARQRTLANGFLVPEQLNQVLDKLGEVPSERPSNFLTENLAEQAISEKSAEDLLDAAHFHSWPIMFGGEHILQKMALVKPEGTSDQIDGEAKHDPETSNNPDHDHSPSSTEDSEALQQKRDQAMLDAINEDPEVRKALQGPLSNMLEDFAVATWQFSEAADAKSLVDLAENLRSSAAPESLEGAQIMVRSQMRALAYAIIQSQNPAQVPG